MIKSLRDRHFDMGALAVVIILILTLFLLQGCKSSSPTKPSPESEAAGDEVAAAPSDSSEQPTAVADEATSTLASTVAPLPSATLIPSPSPTVTKKPTATRTPRPKTPTPVEQSVQALGQSAPLITHTAVPTSSLSNCLDAVYLADVTIPDGTHLEKGESLEKTWSVRNDGTCDWPEDTRLVFLREEQMSAADSVDVGALAAGETIEISVDMVAPDVDANLQGVWQLATANGNFGTLLTVVVQVGEAPAFAPVVPPSGGRIGGGFELGGHVDHFGDAAKMQYAGMKWAKVQMHHGEDASGKIAEAHNNGLKILVGAVGDAGRAAEPGYQEEFAAWLGTVAAKGADAIEVWNEPNIDREWAQGQIDPGAYTEMLRRAYSAIKSNNPGTMVISAALSPTWHNPPFHWGDDVYLSGMVASGAANYVDCYGIHYNSGTVPPSWTSGAATGPHYSWYFPGMINTYWAASGGTRSLCFTELGYVSSEAYCQLPSNFGWAASTTVAQQAAWLAEAAVIASNSGKVRLMIIWNVNFSRYDCGPDPGDPQAGYAIIRPNGGCPACDALHNVTH